MNRSFYLKTKVLLGFGLIFSAIIVASVIAYNSYEQLSQSVQILSRQDPQLQQIDSILVMVSKSENSLQEYTINKSADKLQNYDSLVVHIRMRVQKLKATSAFENSKLDSILNLIKAKMISMDEFMEIKDQRDAFRFYDMALQQLQGEDAIDTVEIQNDAFGEQDEDTKDEAEADMPDASREVQEVTVPDEEDSEQEEEERGWFRKIIDKLIKNNEQEEDTLGQAVDKITSQDDKPSRDSLEEIKREVPNLSVDSVRQMLLKLKSEQAATERYLDEQELRYLSNNARVMNQINELIREVKNDQQQRYARQSDEARNMLQISLSRLGIILVIALGSIFLFVYLIFADIAKSDSLKMQLEQAKVHAEQLAKVKEGFLANMSHEIRTPLTAILGFTGLLSDTRLGKKQEEYVSAVKSSSSHLLSLVNDILDFSKIEAGQLRFESEPFDIIFLVEEVCQSMRLQAEKKDLQIIVEIEGEDLRLVRGDAFRLKQVLYNLISNAIKFTEEGGVILRTKLKSVDEDSITAQLEVTDSGIGIPPEKQKHIFDAFVQSDVSDTRKYGGTGLGLSITRRIIESQGGEIDLESQPGEGTTFYIALPFLKASEHEALEYVQPNVSNMVFPGLKLLVIDDDPLNTQLLALMLEKWKVTCHSAHSGAEGLHLLQQEEPDLILTDLQMPEMPGEQVVRAVRDMGFNALPVVAFTARVTENKSYFIEKGFDDVLIKPFKDEDVVQLLQRYAPEFVKEVSDTQEKLPVKEQEISEEALYSLVNIQRFVGDDPESMLSFIDSFLKVMESSVKQLQLAVEEENSEAIGYHAHKLYPNIAQLQVAELPGLLRKLENEARSDVPFVNLKEDTDRAVQICEKLLSALRHKQLDLKTGVS